MGTEIIDWWSLIHYTSGAITMVVLQNLLPWSKWVLLLIAILIHQLWELFENSDTGIAPWNKPSTKTFFNERLCVKKFCPLSYQHYSGDTATNSASDTLFFALGAATALYVRK